MLFRSDTPIRVSSVAGGHSALVGKTWRELPPILHKPAIEAGCITNAMPMESHNATQETVEQKDDLLMRVKKAISLLSPEDYTGGGLPDLKRLSDMAGFTVTRRLLNEALK